MAGILKRKSDVSSEEQIAALVAKCQTFYLQLQEFCADTGILIAILKKIAKKLNKCNLACKIGNLSGLFTAVIGTTTSVLGMGPATPLGIIGGAVGVTGGAISLTSGITNSVMHAVVIKKVKRLLKKHNESVNKLKDHVKEMDRVVEGLRCKIKTGLLMRQKLHEEMMNIVQSTNLAIEVSNFVQGALNLNEVITGVGLGIFDNLPISYDSLFNAIPMSEIAALLGSVSMLLNVVAIGMAAKNLADQGIKSQTGLQILNKIIPDLEKQMEFAVRLLQQMKGKAI